MDTQEHEYELGTLEENILDRDESQARQSGSRGDERRWMILGGAGTLALLTAIVAAVSLGGAEEARELSASLRGPVRELSALSAHLRSSAPDTASAPALAPQVTPKARIARAQPSVQQPVVAAPVAAALEATKPAAVSTPAPVTHAAVADTAETAFANLPTVSAVEEAAADANDAVGPVEVVPTNFEQDDDPFAEDPSESNDESAAAAEDDDEADEAASDEDGEMDTPAAEVPAPAEAPAPVEAPPPAGDVAVAAPTPA